ncbi:MAG: hypothetical protein Q4F34_00830, partial [Prevotellaceae bacterium]|nr:hypothetical protein [Prevotellaceae bacterium]
MAIKTIEIKGAPFSYNDEDGLFSVATLPGIGKEDAEEILNKTKELFEKIHLKFVLTFGTLLGAIRENGIIDGEEDVDVYIIDEECLLNHLPFLYENGLKIIRIRKGKVYSFRL